MRRRVLRGDRNREQLLDLPLPDVEHRLAPPLTETLLVRAADLVLRNAFLRIELDRLRRRLPRVLLELRAREPERVLRVGLPQAVRDDGELAVLELAVELVTRRGAVLAIAVGLEARDVADRV